MKGNNIDDLFREKLSHQKLTPPPAAWAAVEKGLPGNKKKGIYFWITMAASILLICTLGWIVLRGDATTHTGSSELTAANSQEENKIEENNIKEPVSQGALQAKKSTNPKNPELINEIEEPAAEQLVASHASGKSNKINIQQQAKTSDNIALKKEEVSNSDLIKTEREVLIILPLDPNQHLSINSIAQDLDFMVMPLMLTDYFTPYNEAIKLAPKKKRFRVLSGIISIAKEVNSSKLSFSELRNAKNSFVNDDLKYGVKTEEGEGASSEGENTEDDPNKD